MGLDGFQWASVGFGGLRWALVGFGEPGGLFDVRYWPQPLTLIRKCGVYVALIVLRWFV